jgi:tRNA(fMet)-specific endonuclease VapC
MILLDTDTISFILRKDERCIKRWATYLEKNKKGFLSCISHYEILRGLYRKPHKGYLTGYMSMLQDMEIMDINGDVAQLAAEIEKDLHQAGLVIHTPDSLIAASALYYGMELVTNNSKDFQQIAHLKLDNWVE